MREGKYEGGRGEGRQGWARKQEVNSEYGQGWPRKNRVKNKTGIGEKQGM